MILLAAAGPAAAASVCPETALVAPAAASTIAAARPELAWKEIEGAKRYRVQLESRVPEGEMVARFDAVVEGTRFLPPAALAGTRAGVKVVITADCGGEAPPVTGRGPTFFIDTASACAAPEGLSLKGNALAWKAGGALGYVVTAFAADGRVLLRQDVRESPSKMPAGTSYVSVRARCAAGTSAPVYKVAGSS